MCGFNFKDRATVRQHADAKLVELVYAHCVTQIQMIVGDRVSKSHLLDYHLACGGVNCSSLEALPSSLSAS